MTITEILEKVRAANPDVQGKPDEALFSDILEQSPEYITEEMPTGLSMSQFAAIGRHLNPSLANVATDYKAAQAILKDNPDYADVLNGDAKLAMGLRAWSTPKFIAKESAKIGAEALPIAGAIGGQIAAGAAALPTGGASLIGSAVAQGAGAATGEAAKQGVLSLLGDDDEVSESKLSDIIKEGGLTAITSGMLGSLGYVAKSMRPTITSMIKVLSGVDERTSARVLANPDIILNAKSMAEAQKSFGNFFKRKGFVYGEGATKAATGKLGLSDEAADDLILDTLDKISAVSGKLKNLPENEQFVKDLTQRALAARWEAKDAITRNLRKGNESRVRLFSQGQEKIDDWLEKQIPGFAKQRKMYADAKAKEAFSDVLPKNINKTASVLRTFSGLAASALAYGSQINPITAAAGIASMSPAVQGTILGGIAALNKYPTRATLSSYIADKLSKSIPENMLPVDKTIKDISQDISNGLRVSVLQRITEPYADISDEELWGKAESGDTGANMLLDARKELAEIQEQNPGIENVESIANLAGTAAMVGPGIIKGATSPSVKKFTSRMLKSEKGAVDFTPMTKQQAEKWLEANPFKPMSGASKAEISRAKLGYEEFHIKRLMGLTEGYKETFTPEALKAKTFLDNNLHKSYQNIIDKKDKDLFIHYGVSPSNKVISNIEKELLGMGWSKVHTSMEDGVPTSRYFEKDGTRIRVSNHDVPQTAERDFRESEGRTYWDSDYVYNDSWLKKSPKQIAEEINKYNSSEGE